MSEPQGNRAELERLRRLLSEAADARLDDEGLDAIERSLENEPSLVHEYVEFVHNEALIGQSCGLTYFDENGLGIGADKEPRSTAGETRPVVADRQVRQAGRRGRPAVDARVGWGFQTLERVAAHPLWAVAAMLLLTLSGGLYWLTLEPVARVIAVSEARTVGGVDITIGSVFGADWIELERGSIELDLRRGAMISLEAPVRFRPGGDNTAQLAVGAVSAHVPEEAQGFTLECEHASVVDLGTGFRAVAMPEGRLSIHVTRGMVRVEPSDDESVELGPGGMAAVDEGGAIDFATTAGDGPRTAGRFRYVAEHPQSLSFRAYTEDDAGFVFLESHAVRLPYELRPDISEPGRHQVFFGESAPIEEGTVVDCYLIHCAPNRERHFVDGSVTFDRPILGVICQTDRLNAMNELLGTSWTLACEHAERGAESAPDPNSDEVTISRDRRTLSARFRTMSIDQVRVLVAR